MDNTSSILPKSSFDILLFQDPFLSSKGPVCQMSLNKLPAFKLLFGENLSVLTMVINIQIHVFKTTH